MNDEWVFTFHFHRNCIWLSTVPFHCRVLSTTYRQHAMPVIFTIRGFYLRLDLNLNLAEVKKKRITKNTKPRQALTWLNRLESLTKPTQPWIPHKTTPALKLASPPILPAWPKPACFAVARRISSKPVLEAKANTWKSRKKRLWHLSVSKVLRISFS